MPNDEIRDTHTAGSLQRVLIVGGPASIARAGLDAGAIESVELVESLEEAARRGATGVFDRVIVDPQALGGPQFQVLASAPPPAAAASMDGTRSGLVEANERLRILSDTAGELLVSDDPQQNVESLCRRVMDHLRCDVFFNYLLVEDKGCLRLNACAGVPERTARKIEWLDLGVAICGCVARDGERIVAEDIQRSEDPRAALVRSFGIQAYACHPLLSQGGKAVGTLSFGTRSRASFTGDELSLMKTVADQVSAAMERIRLTEAAARRAAELQSFIASMADGVIVLNGTGDVVLVNQSALEMLEVPDGVCLADWARRCRFFDMEDGRIEPDEVASARALRGAVIHNERYSLETPTGKRLVMGVSASPVKDTVGRVIGSTTVFRDLSEQFEMERRHRETYEREHHIAEVLQQALIPPSAPERLMGYRFAMVYEAAMDEAAVGGDFYDVFEIGEGRIGVLIGDVVGKGLNAAMRVAAARYSVRGYAYLDPRPGRVLTLANSAICRESIGREAMLTAFFAVIDSRVGIMTYSNAGHELPIVLSPDGSCRFIRLPGLPMGIADEVEYGEASERLNPGERVILMTDGITDARPETPDLFGMQGVVSTLRRIGWAPICEMASGILEAATEHANRKLHDDAAVLIFEQCDDSEDQHMNRGSSA